jgi:hypothetical protein
MMITMTPGISDPAEIVEVNSVGWNPKLRSMTACSGGVISILRSPSLGHVGERGGGGEGGAIGGEEKAHDLLLCVSPFLWGPLYIVGRGSTNPSTKVAKGGGHEGEAVARVGPAGSHHPKP